LRHLADGGQLSQTPSGAEESTLRRWWKKLGSQLPHWAGALEARALALSGQAPHLLARVSHPFQRLEKALSQLPPLPARWAVITRTLWWLRSQGFL